MVCSSGDLRSRKQGWLRDGEVTTRFDLSSPESKGHTDVGKDAIMKMLVWLRRHSFCMALVLVASIVIACHAEDNTYQQ